MTSFFTVFLLAEDKDDGEWMVSMLIFFSFPFGDPHLKVEDEETGPVPREGLKEEGSEVVETWERVEGRAPFLPIDE
jgi:hypothetical protein